MEAGSLTTQVSAGAENHITIPGCSGIEGSHRFQKGRPPSSDRQLATLAIYQPTPMDPYVPSPSPAPALAGPLVKQQELQVRGGVLRAMQGGNLMGTAPVRT